MRKLTHQQIFDRAVSGVVRQGELSMVGFDCMYRARRQGKVLACGVGHLIDSDLYRKSIEGRPAADAGPQAWECSTSAAHLGLALAFSGVDITDALTVDLLDDIQTAHDSGGGINEFVERAKGMATRWGLKFPASA